MSVPDEAVITKYLSRLDRAFAGSRDKTQAHRESRPVLEDMAADKAFLTAVLRRHLRRPGAPNKKNYPVVGCNVALTPYFGLEVNCWIPLPGRETNVSTKAIHHHGDMLLTTATAFGPGYEHWTFQRPEILDGESELFLLRPLDRAPHPLHHVDYVDSYVAHLPMYPSALTITIALWSSRFPTTWKDRLKRLAVFRGREGALRNLLARSGLSKALDLKVVEYFDFYPTERGFRGMKERTEFRRGPNHDYLHSLFHVLQETGNDALVSTVKEVTTSGARLDNRALIDDLIRRLESGQRVEGKLSEGHYDVPFANFTVAQIEQALNAQNRRQAAGGGLVESGSLGGV
jgi:hypothetical protein